MNASTIHCSTVWSRGRRVAGRLWARARRATTVGAFGLGCFLAAGAAGAEDGPSLEEAKDHWAFQPVVRSEPPSVNGVAWVQTPVDRFILARLEAEGLVPASAADRATFLRRVTYDLVGLPPTPAETAAYVADNRPGAKARLIERLLASPHYGERWGKHWLDLARFAETDGFEHDAVRPHAWRYRDYVVRSFNEDKAYDAFVREQVAGDELAPENRDALMATAFALLGPDMVDSADQVQRRLNTLNDMTDTTGLVFMGLTVGCARCHDHKFEPISQRDYFRLQAFFAPVEFKRDLPVPTPEQRAEFERAQTAYDRETGRIKRLIDSLEGPVKERLRSRKLANLSEEARAAHAAPEDQRSAAQAARVKETSETVKVTDNEVAAAMEREQRRERDRLHKALRAVTAPDPMPMTLALQTRPDGENKTPVLGRGDYNQPREEVASGWPSIFGESVGHFRRAALAEWLTRPEHPLTSRVMVNRIWQHHFGRGIVTTPSDFGLNGQRPTHPELLDWLASEFVATGWSVKAMHRVILLSAAYEQSSEAPAGTLAADPENRWFSRWDRLRLEGEAIRDSLLAIGGTLQMEVGGVSVQPPIPTDLFAGATGWKASETEADHHRRSLYIFGRRNLRYPFLEVFDAPDSNLSCAMRGESTTAPQSLTLLNADEVVAACGRAARKAAQAGDDRPSQVAAAYRLILGRGPDAEEAAVAAEFLEASPLSEFCRVLFNLNAFVYVD